MVGSSTVKYLDGEDYKYENPELKIIKGSNKKTPNNAKEKRWVDPIRNKQDIQKIKDWIIKKMDEAETLYYRKGYARNYVIFVCGINWGLRISDLLNVKYGDVFEDDMKTFQEWHRVKEKKTGKRKELYFNKSVREAITSYIKEYNIQPEKDDFLFCTNKKDENGRYKPVTDAAVESFLKRACKECGIKGNYNTHSMRKTFCYQTYMALVNNNDPLALPKVQKFLNHRNQSDTLRYLGLDQDMGKEISEMVAL